MEGPTRVASGAGSAVLRSDSKGAPRDPVVVEKFVDRAMTVELALHDIFVACTAPDAERRLDISAVVEEMLARVPTAELHAHMPDAWARSLARAPDVSVMAYDDFADAWNSAIDMCAQQKRFEERFEVVGQIGSGAYATVHLAFDRELRANVALKAFAADRARKAQSEAKSWGRCVHENIIRLHEVISTPKYVYFVIELAPGGELLAKIDQVERFDEEQARTIFRQCAAAICYLHDDAAVAHRDIKPENLLCTSTEHGQIGTVKLTDFGFAARIRSEDGTPLIERAESRQAVGGGGGGGGRPKRLSESFTLMSSSSSFARKSAAKLANLVGTPDYMAPEQVRLLQRREERAASLQHVFAEDDDDYYDESVDCWALGCIAYELLNGSPPFVDEDDDVLNALILNAPIDMSDDSVWGRVSDEAKDLIHRLLDRDPVARLTAREVLVHPWLQRDAVGTDEREGDAAWQLARQEALRVNREHVKVVRDNRRFRVSGIVVNSIVRMAVGSRSTPPSQGSPLPPMSDITARDDHDAAATSATPSKPAAVLAAHGTIPAPEAMSEQTTESRGHVLQSSTTVT